VPGEARWWLPLPARGEPSAAPAPYAGSLDLLDDPFGIDLRKNLLGGRISTLFDVVDDSDGIELLVAPQYRARLFPEEGNVVLPVVLLFAVRIFVNEALIDEAAHRRQVLQR
jgi:hypothetical protein